jgi:hypothetical protein
VTVAHLVESVSVVITPIHERYRRCRNPAGWACRFENSSPQNGAQPLSSPCES